MRLLSLAPDSYLKKAWDNFDKSQEYIVIRQPEVGLAMIKAKACGNGNPFNFGEVPLTRCAVRVGEKIGHGYVQGRKKEHAFHMAIFDALLQNDDNRSSLTDSILTPIFQFLKKKKNDRKKAVEKTKVEFFTMVRGEDSE